MHAHRTNLACCPRLRQRAQRQRAASAGWPHQRRRRPSFARCPRRSWTCLEASAQSGGSRAHGRARAELKCGDVRVCVAHSSACVCARARERCVRVICCGLLPLPMVPALARARTHAHTHILARMLWPHAAHRTRHIMQNAPRAPSFPSPRPHRPTAFSSSASVPACWLALGSRFTPPLRPAATRWPGRSS